MLSTSTLYSKEHPEYYAQDRIDDREREYRGKIKEQALARCYRIKVAKMKIFILASTFVFFLLYFLSSFIPNVIDFDLKTT
jgi:hypothetical protein